jgi:predicted nucleic acid-binding Zn ribbon protein
LAVQRFSAQIHVDAGGYKWINRGGYEPEDGFRYYADSIVLEPAGLNELKEAWRRDGEAILKGSSYDPFVTEPALYRLFAMLDPTPDAILDFACKYGHISTVPDLLEDEGSTLWDWKQYVDEMKDLVEEGDNLLAIARSGKSSAANGRKVVEFVNQLLENVPVYFEASARNGVITLKTHAYNLLDAVKLQLADAVVERKTYRTCEQCAKPFEVSPEFNRSDRVYCSDNCRVKAYQRRRKQAIAMRGKGETLRGIAKKLGSDVPTVKKWVGEARREE